MTQRLTIALLDTNDRVVEKVDDERLRRRFKSNKLQIRTDF